jgi:hypothetical protein
LRHIAGVARHVLRSNVVCGATEPVVAVLRMVSVLDMVVGCINLWLVRVLITLSERWLSLGCVHIEVARFVTSAGNNLVDVASRAAVNVIFLWHVPRVARQVLLLERDVSHNLFLCL